MLAVISGRVPHDRSPNPWSVAVAARRASGAPLLDLTAADPGRAGLLEFDGGSAVALAAGNLAPYAPDPRGLASAREAIALDYAARGLHVAPEAILLTSGTSEAYAHLFRLLADPGERVLVPAPSYPLFEPIAALEGVEVGSYALAWDGRWHLDASGLAEQLRGGARAVIVVQPNHPTGSCFTADEIREIETLCERFGAAIISDEVFGDFAWNDRAALPSLLGERRVATFVLGGLSKSCGLPQLKLSWIAACGPAPAVAESLSGLEWIADLFLSVATPVQVALPELLRRRAPYVSRVRERIAVNRAQLAAAVGRAPALTVLEADGGWHAVLKLPARRSEAAWLSAWLDAGVLAHPGHFYDFASEPFAVISLITEPGEFSSGLSLIAREIAGT